MTNTTQDNCGGVEQGEAHLKRAEADLAVAQAAEQAAVKELLVAEHEIQEAAVHRHEIDFTVDGEECETLHHKRTANQIIKEFGNRDPALNYLIEIRGDQKESFQGRGDEEITLKNCMSFLIISIEPKTVS